MRATILIATRNRADQLRQGLVSIMAKNYRDVEILVIDDASADETKEVLRDYGGKIRVLRIERGGGYRRNPGRILNLGHSQASADVVIEQGGEVCHLTDCVTPLLAACKPGLVVLARVHNGTLEEMEKLKIEIASGRYEFPADVEPEHLRTSGDTWVVPRVGPLRTQLYCGIERQAPFMFLGAIHGSDFRAVGGYDEEIQRGNDENIANRLIANGVRFRFIGNAVAFHLKHGKS